MNRFFFESKKVQVPGDLSSDKLWKISSTILEDWGEIDFLVKEARTFYVKKRIEFLTSNMELYSFNNH